MYSVHWAMVNNYSTVHCFLFCFPFTIYLFTITTVFGSAHRIDANMVMFYRGDCRWQYGTVYNLQHSQWRISTIGRETFSRVRIPLFIFDSKPKFCGYFPDHKTIKTFYTTFFWSAANWSKIRLYLGMFGSGSGKINRILRFRICHVLGSRYKVCGEKNVR